MDRIKVCFVGRMEYVKGVDFLIEVIPEVCKRHDNIDFTLVGDGNMMIKIK